MKLTHLDILEQCFHEKFRGYNKDEVDTFLHLIAEDYKLMTEEVTKVKSQLTAKDRLLKEALKNQTKDPVGNGEPANLEPGFIKQRANNILSAARQQAENNIIKGQEELAALQRDIRKLREEREHLMKNIKSRARTYIESLRNSGNASFKNVSADQKM